MFDYVNRIILQLLSKLGPVDGVKNYTANSPAILYEESRESQFQAVVLYRSGGDSKKSGANVPTVATREQFTRKHALDPNGKTSSHTDSTQCLFMWSLCSTNGRKIRSNSHASTLQSLPKVMLFQYQIYFSIFQFCSFMFSLTVQSLLPPNVETSILAFKY